MFWKLKAGTFPFIGLLQAGGSVISINQIVPFYFMSHNSTDSFSKYFWWAYECSHGWQLEPGEFIVIIIIIFSSYFGS